MKKSSSLIFYFIILNFLFIISCGKIAEDKIEGNWRRVNVENVNSDSFEELKFLSDGTFNLYQYTIDGNIVDTSYRAYGKYHIKIKNFRRILSITETIGNTTDITVFKGDWHIMKLTGKYLVFYKKDPGIDYWEFVKE